MEWDGRQKDVGAGELKRDQGLGLLAPVTWGIEASLSDMGLTGNKQSPVVGWRRELLPEGAGCLGGVGM